MTHRPITDAINSDVSTLHDSAGPTGRMLIDGLDHAVRLQTSIVESYVSWMRGKHPNASPVQIQQELDKHFKRLATGCGGAAGLAAAFPGIGFITGAAAVGAESLVFLNAAALYTTASAHLRGVDIRDPERRRALILVAVLGAPGTALVDALMGDNGSAPDASMLSKVSQASRSSLSMINSQLMKMAKSRLTKKIRNMWIGKLLPLGVGLVLGTMANRKLADQVISTTRESMGPIPSQFLQPLPQKSPKPQRKGLFKKK